MRIREYKSGDLASVVGLFHRTVREVNARDYSPTQISAWAPQSPDFDAWDKRLTSGFVQVCENENEVIGFVRAEADGTLDLLYVHPQCQRLGVASSLFESVLCWATGCGVRRLVSEVSITARPFFERVGFHVVKSQVVVRRGVEFQNFRMEREL